MGILSMATPYKDKKTINSRSYPNSELTALYRFGTIRRRKLGDAFSTVNGFVKEFINAGWTPIFSIEDLLRPHAFL
jgi:hypothetical protein